MVFGAAGERIRLPKRQRTGCLRAKRGPAATSLVGDLDLIGSLLQVGSDLVGVFALILKLQPCIGGLVVDGQATRVGFQMDGDKKVRVAKKTGKVID